MLYDVFPVNKLSESILVKKMFSQSISEVKVFFKKKMFSASLLKQSRFNAVSEYSFKPISCRAANDFLLYKSPAFSCCSKKNYKLCSVGGNVN